MNERTQKFIEGLSAEAIKNLEELVENPMNPVRTDLAKAALAAKVINEWVFDFYENNKHRGPEILSEKRFMKRAEQNTIVFQHFYPSMAHVFAANMTVAREYFDDGHRFS